MPNIVFLLLAGLLVSLPGSSFASLGSLSPHRGEQSQCDVTIRGIHGGASGSIELQLGESDVRNRVGWWTTIGGGIVTLETRERFSEVVSLDFGCNAHRRYRFYFEANVDGTRYQYMHYFPNEDEFTQQTLIDLGDVSRFFDAIEPAPPVDPSDPDLPDSGPIAGIDLQGEWIRRDSNHDPNDGMRIEVTGDGAVLTFVPETASSAHWHVGEVLWQEIGPDGVMRVLGSNDQYFDAQMTAEGRDRLHIDIHYNGAGNDQSWERSTRPTACWPESYMDEYGQRAPGMWARGVGIPAAARDSMYAARDAQAAIQTFAIAPNNEWVIVAANKPCYSSGFPSSAREAIDGFIAQGRDIDVVAFGPGGRWLVVAEDLIRRTTSVSDEIRDEIRRAQGQDRRLTSFAFSDDPDDGWIFTAGGVAYWGDDVNVNIRMAVAAALQGKRPIHEISIGADNSWVLVAEDWFASRGLPPSLLEQLDRYRTDEERRISHVVLPTNANEPWALFSNEAEPTPDPADLINVFEHGLPGDSSVFQRMRRHRITGLSIAVVQNNDVEWARGYGKTEFDVPENYVYPSTVFDAASISKSLTGAAVLQLVEDGAMGLTETNILQDLLGSVMVGGDEYSAIQPYRIHLAHLMRHCAGIDHSSGSSGAEPFEIGETLPTYAEMFLGQSPARSSNAIVRIDSVSVAEQFDYSGANSLLIQALIEHHADGGYDGQMDRLLDNLNMRSSTYRTDFWENMQRERFARGHELNTVNNIQKTNITVYPNQAAAGLRTTAPDLSQFVIMLNQNGTYDGRTILETQTVNQFVGRDGIGTAMGVAERACSENVAMQLHINADNLGSTMNNELVYHGGLHNGYQTFMYALPQRNAGVVILMTGDWDGDLRWDSDTGKFAIEVRNALEAAYNWPNLN